MEHKNNQKNIVVAGGAGFLGSFLCEYLLNKGEKILCSDNMMIDQIYNLACPASPVHYQYNSIRTIKANTIGVINMLGLAKNTKPAFCKRQLRKSTTIPVHPQPESYRGNVNTIDPQRSLFKSGWLSRRILVRQKHQTLSGSCNNLRRTFWLQPQAHDLSPSQKCFCTALKTNFPLRGTSRPICAHLSTNLPPAFVLCPLGFCFGTCFWTSY